jgi:L-histidine Nalpha-methyltransferase / hercynylcysteine S-oxide synthase
MRHAGTSHVEIIDIRRTTVGISILEELRKTLRVPPGTEKRLPTLLLYDEKGLRLFEEITYLKEYYLTGQEISILERNADQIADRIAPNSIIVELGSGYELPAS